MASPSSNTWIAIGKTIAETRRLCWFGRIGFLLAGLVFFAVSILVRLEYETDEALDSPRIHFGAVLFVFGALSLLSAWLIPPLLFKHIVGFELSDHDIRLHFSNKKSHAIAIESVSHIILAYNHPAIFTYSYDILYSGNNPNHNAAGSAVSGEYSIPYHVLMVAIVLAVAVMILQSYGIGRIVYFRKRLHWAKPGVLIEECYSR